MIEGRARPAICRCQHADSFVDASRIAAVASSAQPAAAHRNRQGVPLTTPNALIAAVWVVVDWRTDFNPVRHLARTLVLLDSMSDRKSRTERTVELANREVEQLDSPLIEHACPRAIGKHCKSSF